MPGHSRVGHDAGTQPRNRFVRSLGVTVVKLERGLLHEQLCIAARVSPGIRQLSFDHGDAPGANAIPLAGDLLERRVWRPGSEKVIHRAVAAYVQIGMIGGEARRGSGSNRDECPWAGPTTRQARRLQRPG